MLRVLAVIAVLVAGVVTRSVVAQSLPEGPGRDVVQKRCVSCHESDLIIGQRLTRTGWERSVDKMVRWGAVVDASEREPLVSYLAQHFAVRRVGRPEGRPPQETGEATYKRACLSCHEADIVEQQRLSRAGWLRSIDKMIRWGAGVPEAERDALADYLAAQFPVR